MRTPCGTFSARLSQSRSLSFLVWCGRTSFRSLALRARTIAVRAHCRATRSKARLVSKSIFRREFHLASGLSLYYILLVESSFLPGNIFLRFFIEMHSNFMHLIELKAKLD